MNQVLVANPIQTDCIPENILLNKEIDGVVGSLVGSPWGLATIVNWYCITAQDLWLPGAWLFSATGYYAFTDWTDVYFSSNFYNGSSSRHHKWQILKLNIFTGTFTEVSTYNWTFNFSQLWITSIYQDGWFIYTNYSDFWTGSNIYEIATNTWTTWAVHTSGTQITRTDITIAWINYSLIQTTVSMTANQNDLCYSALSIT